LLDPLLRRAGPQGDLRGSRAVHADSAAMAASIDGMVIDGAGAVHAGGFGYGSTSAHPDNRDRSSWSLASVRGRADRPDTASRRSPPLPARHLGASGSRGAAWPRRGRPIRHSPLVAVRRSRSSTHFPIRVLSRADRRPKEKTHAWSVPRRDRHRRWPPVPVGATDVLTLSSLKGGDSYGSRRETSCFIADCPPGELR
jgi:hypothetical protein